MLENEEIDTTDMPDLESEKSVAERTITKKEELRTQKLNTLKEEKNELFNCYFDYSSPSNMLSKLSDTKGDVNKSQVYF